MTLNEQLIVSVPRTSPESVPLTFPVIGFKYVTLDLSRIKFDSMEDLFNEYGKEGWELVQVYNSIALFKMAIE